MPYVKRLKSAQRRPPIFDEIRHQSELSRRSHQEASLFEVPNISSASVKFNAYEGPGLARNPGAIVIVGMGRNGEGESVGFALEIVSGKGVVASEILVPDGIASQGNIASRRAKISGQPLLDVLVRIAADHRARYPTAR